MQKLKEKQELQQLENQRKRESIELFIIQLNQVLAIEDVYVENGADKDSLEMGKDMIESKKKQLNIVESNNKYSHAIV